MVQLNANRNIIVQNISKEWLLKHGFQYNRFLSDEEHEIYTYRFPVYNYKQFILLDCELCVILGNKDIRINVYEHNTNNIYTPFCYCECGRYDEILSKINKSILSKFKKLGIK